MRLYFKIYLSMVVLLVVILGIDGYLRVSQEVDAFNRDMETDALLIGQALSGLVEHTWKESGENKAITLINNANRKEHVVKIRWVWLDNSATTPYLPQAPLTMLTQVLKGENVSLTIKAKDGEASRFTYLPITTDGQRPGALELSEPLSSLELYTHQSLLRALSTAILLLLTSGLLLWCLFQKMISNPLNRLINKARQIGRGNLAADLVIKGKDEISELGATLNTMSKNLSTAREALRIENEARLAALEQLRHAERLATLGRLSAGMAHELGTPLNVISGRAKLIRTERLEPHEVIECSSIIGEQADRITNIMRDLLDFARRSTLKRTSVNIEQLANHVLKVINPTAHKKQIVFDLTKSGEIPWAIIDSTQIQQVLTNLIMNGIQAMPRGGRLSLDLGIKDARNPKIKDSSQKRYVTVRISDEGEGITEENLKHLFEPFFTTKEAGKGTGLGLSIAYGIVEGHGGWIDAESRSGQGACFTVFLPLEVDQ